MKKRFIGRLLHPHDFRETGVLTAQTCKLQIKVVPGSSRSGIAGWLGEALKVRVTAPPERGKANAEVEVLISAALGLTRGNVKITAGTASSRKTVEVIGLSASEARRRLDDAASIRGNRS